MYLFASSLVAALLGDMRVLRAGAGG